MPPLGWGTRTERQDLAPLVSQVSLPATGHLKALVPVAEGDGRAGLAVPPVPPTGATGSGARRCWPSGGLGIFACWQDLCRTPRRVFQGEGLMFLSSPGDTGAAPTPTLPVLVSGTAPVPAPQTMHLHL